MHARACKPRGSALQGSEAGVVAFSGLLFAMLGIALALEAAYGRRIRVQPLPLDAIAAIGADTVLPAGETLQRCVDPAQLLHVARDLREVEVRNEIAPGLFAAVGNTLCKLCIRLIVVLAQLALDVRAVGDRARCELELRAKSGAVVTERRVVPLDAERLTLRLEASVQQLAQLERPAPPSDY